MNKIFLIIRKRIKKLLKLSIIVIFIIFVLAILFGEEGDNTKRKSPQKEVKGNIIKVGDIPGIEGNAKIHEEGWSKPIKLVFNDEGWEDSPFITKDGGMILFFYHPNKSLADPKQSELITEQLVKDPKGSIKKGLDGKIYYSKRPFTEKHIHNISKNKKYPSTEACPFISDDGELYYCSTKESWIQGKDVPTTVYKNNQRLDFGTGKEENNPHYVVSKDEMWFDCPGDENICVMRNAKKSGFKGKVERAPYPINTKGTNNSQAYLTKDGSALYFTSDRSGTLAIYKTTRIDKEGYKWSKPTLFISHPSGVAEVSITEDGKELVFAQLFWREDGTTSLDIYYAKREL